MNTTAEQEAVVLAAIDRAVREGLGTHTGSICAIIRQSGVEGFTESKTARILTEMKKKGLVRTYAYSGWGRP